MLLALAALYAGSRKGCVLSQGYCLSILEPAVMLVFTVHGIVSPEYAGNVYSLYAWHAVPAAGTANLFLGLDFLYDLFDESEVRFIQTAWFTYRGITAVFLLEEVP